MFKSVSDPCHAKLAGDEVKALWKPAIEDVTDAMGKYPVSYLSNLYGKMTSHSNVIEENSSSSPSEPERKVMPFEELK
tara:strand:+ start:508 stop:741 length:234 start_codon:yes stop_codon:yes gene_type:complete